MNNFARIIFYVGILTVLGATVFISKEHETARVVTGVCGLIIATIGFLRMRRKK